MVAKVKVHMNEYGGKAWCGKYPERGSATTNNIMKVTCKACKKNYRASLKRMKKLLFKKK